MKENEEQFANSIQKLLVNCSGYRDDELSTNRKQAYDYYHQRPRGDELSGRSQIVTGDLSAMVEGNLAQMVEPLAGKRIAEFCAYGKEDKKQADLESDCVHEMIFERENGFIAVTEAIKDALLLRNGVVKVYVDTRKFRKTVRARNVTPEIVPNVLDHIGATEVHSYDAKTGKLSATVTKETKRFRTDALAPENLLLPKGWHRQDFDDCPIVAEYHVEPRSTLIERGFPKAKVDKMRRCTQPTKSAQLDRLPNGVTPQNIAIDKSQELVAWYECYVRVGAEDGSSELRCVAKAADQSIILEDEPADAIVYASGTSIINPHSWVGISLHDKLKSTQDSSVALTRALMDNLNATTKNRTAHLDGIVEQDDLEDGRVNSSIRVKSGVVQDVRQAITAFQVPDTSGNIIQNLQHMKQTRSEMGGAALDMATGQVQLADRTGSQGLDRAYSVMEALAAFMTRIIAHTLIRQMYLRTHEVLRAEWHEDIQFQRGKVWAKTNPKDWPARTAIRINLGASVGERARMAGVLSMLMEKQAALAAHGMEGILVDAESYYNAFTEWLRINDIPVAERYVLDPTTPAAMQRIQQKEAMRQRDAQKQQAMMNDAVALEQMRVALDKYKSDQETQFKYYAEVLNAQIEEAKLATQAVVDLQKSMMTAASAAKANTDGDGNSTDSGNGSDEKGASPSRKSGKRSGNGSGKRVASGAESG